ncbi:MAG: IclR family transcriptional regulator [Lysinibacillus sp.]
MDRNKTIHRLSTVDNAISVLSMFLRYETISLTDIEQALGISKTAAFRLAATLADRGFLVKNNEQKTYKPGPIIFQIVNRFQTSDITAIAQPFLQELADLTNEAVYLSIRTGNKFVFLSGFKSTFEKEMVSPLGQEFDLYFGAVGKLHMAYMSDADLATYFKRTALEQFTTTTIIDSEKLQHNLQQIRDQGVALSIGERIENLGGVACPIWGFSNEPIAALAIYFPLSRMDLEHHQPLIKHYADEISKAFQESTRS